ncbi:hypothetical protein AK812_SmicGene19088 [Symbiodinium microadriaticum]|uniref:Uncharacterized protein n=1 Tax=Symbiodinium microadriaticum TaxID=2951 RepID=A0A1Q9DTD8_SYMMI|nr:hypothetical protein AK812_SmicGene19088 [Symbiodinium microadriaticum]
MEDREVEASDEEDAADALVKVKSQAKAKAKAKTKGKSGKALTNAGESIESDPAGNGDCSSCGAEPGGACPPVDSPSFQLEEDANVSRLSPREPSSQSAACRFHVRSAARSRDVPDAHANVSNTSIASESGSCPAKPKPSVQMHEVQTPVIVEGSNVWAAKRSGSEFQARLGVWAMKRQWSEATLTKPSPVLALREELVSPFQKSQPHKRGSCGTSAIWHIGSRKACIQGWEPLSPQREQKEQVLAAPLHRLPAAQAAHGSPSPVKSPRLTAPPLLPPQSSPPREDAVPRARVAIVGAGPVGLWVAVLLARAHARLFFTASGFRIKRLPGAPDINVFERRTDEGGWGSRRIVLAMSNASQDVLNSRLMSERELCAHHCFSPTCSINLIESILREGDVSPHVS